MSHDPLDHLAPPALARALLARVLGQREDAHTIQGDLWEDFLVAAHKHGAPAARRWYWRQAIALSMSRVARRSLHAVSPQRTKRRTDVSMGIRPRNLGITRDIRYALRTVRREPGFFGLSAVIVGLGVGACTAVFSVLSPLLLRPLPFERPDQLVWVANNGNPENGMSAVTSRTSNLRDFRAQSASFDGLTGYNAFFGQGNYTLQGDGPPELLIGAGVAGDFLEVLGVQPLYGRNFVEEESVWAGRPAVILSHGFWLRRFAGDPSIVGTAIDINDRPTEVVGILPPRFDFASIFAPTTRVDFLEPWPIADQTDRWGNTTSMIGRLKPGVTVEQAQAELHRILEGLQEAEPDRWGLGAVVTGLQAQIAGPYRTGMVLLGAAAGTVMLIVCVNLSILLMAKGSRRAKEMAVRTALGATRTRLIQQLIAESLVLTVLGAVVGLVIAFAVTGVVSEANSMSIPLLASAAVDAGALLFTLALTIAAGLLMGIVPALQATHRNTARAINESTRGSSAGRGGTRLREGLVVAEVAMACVLLVVGGLFIRSFQNVLQVDLGFDPTEAIGWTLSTTRTFESTGAANAFYEQIIDRVEAVPGVEEAGLIDELPLGRNRTWGAIQAVGEVYEDDELQSAFPHIVDERYLETMRIPLLAGRHFNASDAQDTELVVILNESAARGVFRGADPIGRRVQIIGREWTVIGIAHDVRHQSLEQGSGWQMYIAYTQLPDSRTYDMVVRSALPVDALASSIAAALRSVDPAMPTDDFETLTSIVDRSVSARRFILLLLTAFGGTALLLAALGIYGVLSYSVTERIPEIGIRMALGESVAQVQRRVVGKTLALAGLGVVIGAGASLVGTRSIASLLYGIDPTDPVTFGAMAVILLSVGALAGYLPAYRASRTDPTTAFRSV
jgi:predicted permease